jgi:hypothetical protein
MGGAGLPALGSRATVAKATLGHAGSPGVDLTTQEVADRKIALGSRCC